MGFSSSTRRGAVALFCVTVGFLALPAATHVASAAASPAGPGLSAAAVQQLLEPVPGIHVAPRVAVSNQISAAASAAPPNAGNLEYHGGPVMRTSADSVPIFWFPATVQSGRSAAPDAQYVSLVQRYFADVGGSNLDEVNTEYFQTVNGPVEFITNASQQLLAVVDTSRYPTAGAACAGNGQDCVTDSQIQAEISAVRAAHAIPGGLGTVFYVFLAPHETQCAATTFCFKADGQSSTNFVFCAYHSSFQDGTTPVVYASMPYDRYNAASTTGGGCSALSAFPNSMDADIEISITSHEQMEATTDPGYGGDAWFDSTGQENGDKCAYDYGALSLDNGLANEQWNGHYYVVQQEWSNAIGGCTQGRTPNVQWNDAFASAEVMADGSVTAYASTVRATKEAGEPTPVGDSGGHSVWYQYAASATGPVTVTTCGSTFDTVLGVYAGASVDSLTSIAEDDNGCGSQSRVTFGAVAGTTYRVEVDGHNGATGTVAITWDASAAKGVSVSPASVLEGNSGTRIMKFPVTLPAPATGTVTVQYAVTGVDAVGGSRAGAGADFKFRSGTVTFRVSAATGRTPTAQYVAVTVFGDTDPEGDQRLSVQLSNPSGTVLGRDQADGTILDDDTGPSTVIGVGNAAVVEGDSGTGRNLVFPVTLSAPATGPVTVHYQVAGVDATYGRTAGGGADFGGRTSGTISFPLLSSGRTGYSKIVSIPVWADQIQGEGDELLLIMLDTPTGPVALGRNAGIGVIENDD
jgi:hypothetical protein